MDFLTHLWMPILVSGVAVWVVSAICWMAIGHHNKDAPAVPNEKEFIDTLKRLNVPPGNYGFPDFQACKGLSRDERKKKALEMFTSGPMGMLRVWAPINMGLNMFLTFLFYLVTSAVIAYLAWAVLPHGEIGARTVMSPTTSKIFQFAGTAALLAYCFATFPNDVWFQKQRRAMLMNFIDGVIFAMVTGGIFAWLWPRG